MNRKIGSIFCKDLKSVSKRIDMMKLNGLLPFLNAKKQGRHGNKDKYSHELQSRGRNLSKLSNIKNDHLNPQKLK